MKTRSTFSLRNPVAFTLAALGLWAVMAPNDADAAKYRFEAKGTPSVTGPSGYGGDKTKRVFLIYGQDRVFIGEKADIPAWFSSGGDRAEFKEGNATDWKMAKLAADGVITGIEVCTNGPANDTDKHRVKGVKLWGKIYNRDSGKLEGSTEDKLERTNCPTNGWRGRKNCPAGQVAIGFDVYAGDNDAITGIGLVCTTFDSKLYLEEGEKCTRDGTACNEWTYCRFGPMQNCGNPPPPSATAKQGLPPAKVEGVCTQKDFSKCWGGLSEAERTEKVCGCDGKLYDNICAMRAQSVSRAPDMQFCAPKR